MEQIERASGWRNSEERYGLVSIVLHWAAAAAILAMLATAAWAWAAPNDDINGARLMVHGAIGVVVLPLIALRVIWRLAEHRPRSLDPGALGRVARWTHILMLVLITVQLVSGPTDIWTGGWPIGVFGWFEIPPPFKGGSPQSGWHHLLHNVHTVSGFTVAALVAVHIGAALKHLLIDRDRVVQRMLGISSDGRPT